MSTFDALGAEPGVGRFGFVGMDDVEPARFGIPLAIGSRTRPNPNR